MNKFNKIFTFALPILSCALTALPMHRLARPFAAIQKLAPKVTPALANSQRRLLSAAPKVASLQKFSGKQWDNNNQHNNFSRSWLPALGAATALGLNWNRDKAQDLRINTTKDLCRS